MGILLKKKLSKNWFNKYLDSFKQHHLLLFAHMSTPFILKNELLTRIFFFLALTFLYYCFILDFVYFQWGFYQSRETEANFGQSFIIKINYFQRYIIGASFHSSINSYFTSNNNKSLYSHKFITILLYFSSEGVLQSWFVVWNYHIGCH